MNNNKGITYIELILAILIASFIVIGYTQVMTNSSKIMIGSGNDTNALIWLNETLETIRSKNYSELKKGVWTPESTGIYSILGSTSTKKLGTSNITFKRQLAISKLVDDLRAIEVNVIWTEGTKQESISGWTMKAKLKYVDDDDDGEDDDDEEEDE